MANHATYLGRGARRAISGSLTKKIIPCLVALAATACGTASPPPAVSLGVSAAPVPSGVVTGKAALAGSSVVDASRACVSSLAPDGPVPPPGHEPAGSTMATIYHRGYLIVAVDQTIPLLGYRDPATGQIDGFDVAVARQVAQAIFGNENAIKFVAVTPAQRQYVVQHREVDILASPTTITCDRLSWADFSTPILIGRQRVLVPSTSTVQGMNDLGGQKVCAAAATTSIYTIAVQPSHPIPVAVPTWSDCLAMLQQGQVAAISTTDTILAGLAAQDPQTKIVGPDLTYEPQGLVMSKQAKDLVRFVNAVLEQMRTDGEWALLYERYFGTRLQPQVPSPPAPLYCAASCLD
jgi:polar amino acid transport system substrate-binding protein